MKQTNYWVHELYSELDHDIDSYRFDPTDVDRSQLTAG